VLLYTRKGIFQARVYRGDRHYIFRSLKTRKLEDARRLARSLFYEIEIIREKGAPIKSKSIRDVIKEYIEFRELDYKHGNLSRINDANQQKTSIHLLRQIKRASWFWLEYCGNKEVEKIDNSTLKNYASWRRDYYHKIPEVKRPKISERTQLTRLLNGSLNTLKPCSSLPRSEATWEISLYLTSNTKQTEDLYDQYSQC